MLEGINHITFAVSSLEKSLSFYVSLLGMKLVVKWNHGAYLSVGKQWICLSVDNPVPAKDYTHIAFSVAESEFARYVSRLNQSEIKTWKRNKSEGQPLYILDPDGHKLEIHSGNLDSRLEHLKISPYAGLTWH